MNALLAVATGLAAGIAASPHCALMCGPLQFLPLRHGGAAALLPLHGGRVFGYALLGAASGAAGLLLLRQLPSPALGVGVQMLAALALIAIGVRRWRHAPSGCDACPSRRTPRGGWFARGLLRAALPCASLYAMLLLAAAWSDPLHGTLLLAAFGVGTLPALGGAGLLLQRYGYARRQPLAAALLVGSGVLALAAGLLHDPATSALCLTPR